MLSIVDYQIPIANIDSIVIGEIDVQQFDTQIEEISNFINEQTELELNAFQSNLLTWLNANENIQKATINENKNFISVLFKNGMDFIIDFQDMSFFYEYDASEEKNKKLRKVSEYDEQYPFFDVSSEKNEEILKNKILYIQGHDFRKEFELDPINDYLAQYFPILYDRDLSIEENERLINEITSSPVNLELKTIPHSLLFLDEYFPDYGLVLIAQTHGLEDDKGSFIVDDINAISEKEKYRKNICINQRAYQLYYFYHKESNRFIVKKRASTVFIIKPPLLSHVLNGSNAIVFGSYCYSYGLADFLLNNTIFGYIPRSSYNKNSDYLVYYVYNMLLGKTHEQAMKQVENDLGSYFFIASQDMKPTLSTPKTNHPNSKQRFFSIKTNDVTFDENGKPIVSGKINGYENLKTVDYFLFEYDVEDADDSDWGSGSIDVKPDGTFKLTCSDDLVVGKEYGFLFGFSYGNNHYYGEAKFAEIPQRPLCPDDNHPHMIDLGIGTKWACCNVGAHSPEEYGGYYAWGETEEKEVYKTSTYKYYQNGVYVNLGSDISGTGHDVAHVQWGGSWCMPTPDEINALVNNCSSVWTKENGVYGRRFTGPSGGSIFLPAAGSRWDGDLYYAGEYGYYWSSTQGPDYSNRADDLYFNSGLAYWSSYGRYRGQSVRPVVRN